MTYWTTGDILTATKLNNMTPLFGTGSDGDVTISTNTTLTSHKYYNNLTINAGISLDVNNYCIFVKKTLTVNGIIHCNGNDAVTSTPGAGRTAILFGESGTGGTVVGGAGAGGGGGGIVFIVAENVIISVTGEINAKGGIGGNGYSTANYGNGNAGSDEANSYGNNGGAGGNSHTAYVGGAGGVATLSTFLPVQHLPLSLYIVYTKIATGGAGGGGGGLYPQQGGGGGGGGGGSVIILKLEYTNDGLISVAGGAGGVAYGDADNGSVGSNGNSYII